MRRKTDRPTRAQPVRRGKNRTKSRRRPRREGERDGKRPSSSTSCFIGFCVCTIQGVSSFLSVFQPKCALAAVCASEPKKMRKTCRPMRVVAAPPCTRAAQASQIEPTAPQRTSATRARTEDEPRRASHSPDANDANKYISILLTRSGDVR